MELPIYSKDIEAGVKLRWLSPVSTINICVWQPKVTVSGPRTDLIAVVPLRVMLISISGAEGNYEDDRCQPASICPSNLPSLPSDCGAGHEIQSNIR